ncbi:MAG: hypothetical protein Q4F57_05805 [Weeksellaceae bacterium]|nr:hypothetical protein [Weeksellaceae bacterium]
MQRATDSSVSQKPAYPLNYYSPENAAKRNKYQSLMTALSNYYFVCVQGIFEALHVIL